MLVSKELNESLERMQNDHRLGPSHISLFIAILKLAETKEVKNPLSVNRRELMPMAKILARETFDKNMRDLHNYGYIRYIPSYSPYLGNLVYTANEGEGIRNNRGGEI